MREYVDIPAGSEIEKEVVRMTGMGQTIYEKGREEGLIPLFKLVKDGIIKFADAVAYSSMSEEEFDQKMKKAGY